MRHAKSDWSTGLPDRERPLNKRGTAAAKTMGAILARHEVAPDLVYTSAAVRASRTAELAKKEGRWDAPIEVFEELYGASVEDTVAVASHAPGDVQSLMLVGHQPAWGALVAHLTGGAVQMKTATVAAIDLHTGSWTEIPPFGGELVFVLQPRMFSLD